MDSLEWVEIRCKIQEILEETINMPIFQTFQPPQKIEYIKVEVVLKDKDDESIDRPDK